MHWTYSSANNSLACLSSITTSHRERWERRREKRGALFKEPEGKNLCGCGRTAPPSFTGCFITEGKLGPPQSPPHHRKYGGEMMCVSGGMWSGGKRKTEEGDDEEEEQKNGWYKGEMYWWEYLPESPTGAEYVVPPVSLDEGPESGESDGKRDSELVLTVFLCVMGDGSKAAAVRPSIIRVKSMPNEDADDEAHTLSHTHSREFLTPLIIPPIIRCFGRNVSPASLHRRAAEPERVRFFLSTTGVRAWVWLFYSLLNNKTKCYDIPHPNISHQREECLAK